MPLMVGNFIDELAGKEKHQSFVDQGPNAKALKDLRYLASQTNLSVTESLGKLRLIQADGSVVADVLPVAVNKGDDSVNVPITEIDVLNDKHYVGAVVYDGETPSDVLLFKASLWAEKKGLFSIFKINKKTNEYVVKISNSDKVNEYKFGNVLKDYLK